MANAQDFLDILTLSGRYTSPTEYDSSLSGNAQEKGSFIGITVPIPLSKKTIIYNSLNHFYFQVNNDADLNDNLADPIKLNAFILRTGLIQRFSDGKSIQLLVAPRFMTDGKGEAAEKFQFGGLAMYENIFSDKLTMGFGAMYNQEEFGPYFIPLVNLKWKPVEKFSIAGLLPIYAKINYHMSEKFTTGISHFGLLTTFPLGDANYTDDYMERQSIDLALFGKYSLFSNVYVEARFGKALSRSYKQYGPDDKVDFAIPLAAFGDDRVPKNIQFKDGMFVELRVIYSIPIPED